MGLGALGLKARASPRGESGESEVRSWKREGLEGERERERRRSCR
jgi:plasmid stability protein